MKGPTRWQKSGQYFRILIMIVSTMLLFLGEFPPAMRSMLVWYKRVLGQPILAPILADEMLAPIRGNLFFVGLALFAFPLVESVGLADSNLRLRNRISALVGDWRINTLTELAKGLDIENNPGENSTVDIHIFVPQYTLRWQIKSIPHRLFNSLSEPDLVYETRNYEALCYNNREIRPTFVVDGKYLDKPNERKWEGVAGKCYQACTHGTSTMGGYNDGGVECVISDDHLNAKSVIGKYNLTPRQYELTRRLTFCVCVPVFDTKTDTQVVAMVSFDTDDQRYVGCSARIGCVDKKTGQVVGNVEWKRKLLDDCFALRDNYPELIGRKYDE